MKVVSDFQCRKYRILTLDGSKWSVKKYHKYRINGKEYEPVPVYDAGDNIIAVESEESFSGKEVEFI